MAIGVAQVVEKLIAGPAQKLAPEVDELRDPDDEWIPPDATGTAIETALRPGGDEFAVILPRCSPDEALAIADRICENVKAANTSRVTASAGLAPISDSPRPALLAADELKSSRLRRLKVVG